MIRKDREKPRDACNQAAPSRSFSPCLQLMYELVCVPSESRYLRVMLRRYSHDPIWVPVGQSAVSHPIVRLTAFCQPPYSAFLVARSIVGSKVRSISPLFETSSFDQNPTASPAR